MNDPGHFNVFAHLTAEKRDLYRSILATFAAAKARFVIHLRPRDVEAALREAGAGSRAALQPDGPPLEAALQQLADWGNLQAHPDTAEVATVEDFWRARFFYQMSAAGEAAEEAVAVFERSIREPGELQSAALDDIRQRIDDIVALAREPEPDAGRVYDTFTLLRQRFEDLTAQAQRFIGSLQRRVDLQGLDVESFLHYKRLLIDYLERFLSDLVFATHEIATRVFSVDDEALARLLELVVRRELVDRLIAGEGERAAARQAALDAWRSRWRGLASWFVGEGGAASQSQELRARARSAITSLVAAVSGINDRRAGRSDRAADFRVLAAWFADARGDAEAHRLWRSAFGLHPCRHLTVDDDTLERRDASPVPASTSWLAAPPLEISPRLFKSGRYAPRGRPPEVIDRSAEKRLLARLAREEAEQVEVARRRFATGAPTRLSELGELSRDEFALFLDLLGDALAAKTSADEAVSTLSSDGTLRITLEPTRDGEVTTIGTTLGLLCGEDHYLTVSRVLADGQGATTAAVAAAEAGA